MNLPVLDSDPPGLAAIDREIAADQGQRLAGPEQQLALIDSNAPRRLVQEAERLGWGDGQAAASLIDGREAGAVSEAQLVRRADVERTRHVELGVGAEHDTGRVEEVEVGLPDLGC